jgi:hypothetical protein
MKGTPTFIDGARTEHELTAGLAQGVHDRPMRLHAPRPAKTTAARWSAATAGALVAALLLGPAADGAEPATTRLVHGPLAFRLTDWREQPSTTSYGDYRYAIVFKLNRNPQGRLPPHGNYGEGGTSLGNYALDGYDTLVSHLRPVSQAPAGKVNCFVGYVDDVNPVWLRKEDKVPLRARVRVALHPFTKTPDGKVAFGKLLVRHVPLQPADVRFRTADAHRRLRAIGC